MTPDLFPAVSVDRRLGELVSDISIDYPALVTLMRERGFTDEDIAKTTIGIHSETPSTNVRYQSGDTVVPVGSYDYISRDIALYPTEKIEESAILPHAARTSNLSQEFSEALTHELEHHAVEVLEGGAAPSKAECIAMGKSALKLLGGFSVFHIALAQSWDMSARMANYDPSSAVNTAAVLSSAAVAAAGALAVARPWEKTYDHYRRSSIEEQGYAAELNTPKNLVAIQPKQTD